jgi:hypothetical protein
MLNFLPTPPMNPLVARNVALDVRVIAEHMGALADLGRAASIAANPTDARHHLAAVRSWAERGLAELEARAHG